MENIIYTNEYLSISEEDQSIFIQVAKKGFSLQDFHELMKQFPRISILHFVPLKVGLETANNSIVKIGALKPKLELIISPDQMVAYCSLNMTATEFEDANKKEILVEIVDASSKNNIVYGVDVQEIMYQMKPMEKFIIAKGRPPIKGDDALITMYEIKELEPKLVEDGKVNHYELNLINKVEVGDWLGERKEPTKGIPGTNIYGREVPPTAGRQERLFYDAKNIAAELDPEKGITTLTAKCKGAVTYSGNTIGICNLIEIDGDVSFASGNVDFDGYVDVKKTVDDNFSIRAQNDVQILGEMGIGGVDTIESRDGKVYIRGGVAGKNKAKIFSEGDLYTKFASDCTIECHGTVNIGYYAMNCNITAEEVILASPASKIIGGVTKVRYKVDVAELGSKAGILTKVIVDGFDRDVLMREIAENDENIAKSKEIIETLKTGLSRYSKNSTDVAEIVAMQKLEEELYKNKDNLVFLLDRKKKLAGYLRTKGDGEVKVRKAVHPKAMITMKEDRLTVEDTVNLPMDYYLEEGVIKIK